MYCHKALVVSHKLLKNKVRNSHPGSKPIHIWPQSFIPKAAHLQSIRLELEDVGLSPISSSYGTYNNWASLWATFPSALSEGNDAKLRVVMRIEKDDKCARSFMEAL